MDETTLLDLTSNTDRPDWQDTRLAELVLHLTGCSADEALLAIAEPAPDVPARTDDALDPDEALERVARAVLRLRKVDERKLSEQTPSTQD
jgi:hypothetical protein